MDILLWASVAGSVVSTGGLIVAVVRERNVRVWSFATGGSMALMLAMGFIGSPGRVSAFMAHPAASPSVAASGAKSDGLVRKFSMDGAGSGSSGGGGSTGGVGAGGVSPVSTAGVSAGYESKVTQDSGMLCFDSKDELVSYESLYGDNSSPLTSRFVEGMATIPYGTSLRVLQAESDGRGPVVMMKVLIQEGERSGNECWAQKSVDHA